ncbi:MAG: ATP-binding cassette domain-containing protein [Sandaracinaceae bacterium]|nr:ATP-binding cassette domain-containing protein [Sandaracinaceae bacterium]
MTDVPDTDDAEQAPPAGATRSDPPLADADQPRVSEASPAPTERPISEDSAPPEVAVDGRPSAASHPPDLGAHAATSAPAESGEVIIEVRGVTKRFDQEGTTVQVLSGIDLDIRNGEMICIQGRSGAGKSTLLHILGTLDLPTTGSVRYHGRNVTRFTSRELAAFRNATIGFVFQFHHLLPEFDALENVMMPGLVQGRPRAPLRRRAHELLESVGLGHRIDHRPGELSGGEQQRVALARALVMKPQVILADEPTGNLDTSTSDAMFNLFFTLNRELGTTFVIVTHSDDLAERMPRRIVMSDGLIAGDHRRSSPYRTAPAAPPADAEDAGATLDPL